MNDPSVRYMDGEVDVWDYLDIDEVLIHVIDQLFKGHNYHSYNKVH